MLFSLERNKQCIKAMWDWKMVSEKVEIIYGVKLEWKIPPSSAKKNWAIENEYIFFTSDHCYFTVYI